MYYVIITHSINNNNKMFLYLTFFIFFPMLSLHVNFYIEIISKFMFYINLTFIYNYICMLFTTLILILKTIYKFAYLSCFMDIHNFFKFYCKTRQIYRLRVLHWWYMCTHQICHWKIHASSKCVRFSYVKCQKTKESNWPFYSTITVEM